MSAPASPPRAFVVPHDQVDSYLDWLMLHTAESDPAKAAQLSMVRTIQQRLEVLEAMGAIALILLALALVFRFV